MTQMRDGSEVEDPRLGRLEEFDEESRSYPVRALLGPEEQEPRTHTWGLDVFLDQGSEGACTGFSLAHELAADPEPIPVTDALAFDLYCLAQRIDEWAGTAASCPEPEEPHMGGSSVLATLKVAAERNWVSEYRWAFGEADLALAVSWTGPAMLGIPWLAGMGDPDADGFIHAEGAVQGGHAICCVGLDLERGAYILHNSWGPSWGAGGRALITRADLARLLEMDGEAAIPLTRGPGEPDG